MVPFGRDEARAWAREQLRGVVNVTIPTFTSNFTDVNEAAVRHDVARAADLGFLGTLVTSEAATTPGEYLRVVEWAVDESPDGFLVTHHASFDTLEQNIAMAQAAERAGATLSLLAYPPTFYPRSEDDVLAYTKAVCDASGLGVIIFPIPLWGFERLHPASMSVELLDRILDECPTVVAIKAEGGFPSLGGFAQVWHRYSDRVLVTMPVEQHAIPLAALVPMQLIATSNTEYYGSTVPRMLELVLDGKVDDAMELFWQIEPARRANRDVANVTPQAKLIHRMAWKYQGWLNGFNGGPLRMPTMRLGPGQMAAFRKGVVDSGLDCTSDADEAFFRGRNPT
jgi:4-hydroxy-tetrahydrodipicolinate synthase